MKKKQQKDPNSEIALQMLSRLYGAPNVSQRGLASDLGVSLGSVNYCLKALVSKGYVKAGNFSKSNNKLGYGYLLTPAGIKEKSALTASFLKRKQAEYQRLEQEIAELQAELSKQKSEGA